MTSRLARRSRHHSNDAWMIYAGKRFFFLLKLFLEPGILDQFLEQNFNDYTFRKQFLVTREVHNAEASLAKLFFNRVAILQFYPGAEITPASGLSGLSG